MSIRKRCQEDGCTIMLAVGSPASDGGVIVAKNRDVATVSSPEIVVLAKHANGTRYLGISTVEDPASLTLAMNDKGVILNTAGRYCREPRNPGLNSGVIIRRCIELSSSAKEITINIQNLVTQEGKSKNGSAFACADAREAYVVEAYRRETDVIGPFTDTLLAYGNYTLSEQMKQHEKRSRGLQRAKRARELMEENRGHLTVPFLISVCRDHERPPDASRPWDDDNVCTHGYRRDTRGSGICVADRKHPALLSVLWAALNLPCRTPYLPFYLGVNQLPKDFSTAAAYEVFESLGMALEKVPRFKPEVRQHWEAFEFQTLREAGPLERKVRKLADQGKAEEAAALLTEFTAGKAKEALAEAKKITRKLTRESMA